MRAAGRSVILDGINPYTATREVAMFVAVVHFPPVPAERDGEFQAWFAWSNDQLRSSAGLVGRRLLRDSEGAFVGLVEHESATTFAQMHDSPAAQQVQQRLHAIIDGGPRADGYEVVEAAAIAGCCGSTGGDAHTAAAERVEVGTASGAGCCHGS